MLVKQFILGEKDTFMSTIICQRNQQNKKHTIELGVVAHSCNPSFSGGRCWEDCSFESSLGKKFARPHLNQQARSDGCGSSYQEAKVEGLQSEVGPGQKCKMLSKE
jgi:hypothetical protein